MKGANKQYRQVAVSNTILYTGSGACSLIGWNLINSNSANAYLKLYDAASGAVVGTNVKRTLLIPGAGTVFLSNEDAAQLNFGAGIALNVVTGIADSDNSAPSIGCYIELLYESGGN